MESHIVSILFIILGLAMILGGANYLTDGASSLAKRFNISEFTIGLTIVALGTSLPEMVVSLFSAVGGNSDIAIGNIVGSNSFNTLVIVGFCALFSPMLLTRDNIRRDIPLGIGVSIILFVATLGGVINRFEGGVMLALYLYMMYYSIVRSRRVHCGEGESDFEGGSGSDVAVDEVVVMPFGYSVLFTIGGLLGLFFGGRLFIDNAIIVAEYYGISDNIIAITLVAGGTSLPEFAASVVALLKGKSDIALGNIIGSNIANILLVLGVSSLYSPLTMSSISMFDIAFILSSSILLWVVSVIPPRKIISRFDAVLFITLYCTYLFLTLRS